MAASQAAGVVENLPSGAKNIGVGHAARNGFFAALMAAQGYTGAPAALEGPYGWARACGDVLQRERLGPISAHSGRRPRTRSNPIRAAL